MNLKKPVVHEKLIELLAIPLGDQNTVTKCLVNESHETKQFSMQVLQFISCIFVPFVDQKGF